MSLARWSPLALAFLALQLLPAPASGCAPAPRFNMPAVNADQSVIILWDGARKTQHFIRKASFKSEGDDFGFLVPSPTQPELAESGNDAFPALEKLTEPPVTTVWQPRMPLGCCAAPGLSADAGRRSPPPVRVLEEKLVAGFNAVVLEADSAAALTGWLKTHGYTYSPEVAAWARPYVEAGWKITALKVAKGDGEKDKKTVSAAALRMSFKTDRPLFPYREPDPTKASAALEAKERLLRIYFIAEAKYQGELTKRSPWTGKVAWAGKVAAKDRRRILELLKLPPTTGPAQWWLTEFEDNWPYRPAPADVYFSRSRDQKAVKREPIIQYVSARFPADVTVYAICAALLLVPLVRLTRWRARGGR
jgi:hypothetical protein